MSIPMSQIPDSLLVPGQYQEIDNSLAGSSDDVKRVLVVGIMARPERRRGKPSGVSERGAGPSPPRSRSPAASVWPRHFLYLDKVEEVSALPSTGGAAGVTAVKKLAFAAAGAQAGVFTRYIGGVAAQIATYDADTAAAIAARFVAAVNAQVGMQVEASINGAQTSEVLLTSHVKGEVGKYVDVVAGLYGETDPQGVTAVLSTLTPGAGNPSAAAALVALGDVRYHYLVTDLADAVNLGVLADVLEDRYSALRQIGGRVFIALSGDPGDEVTAGTMIYQALGANSPASRDRAERDDSLRTPGDLDRRDSRRSPSASLRTTRPPIPSELSAPASLYEPYDSAHVDASSSGRLDLESGLDGHRPRRASRHLLQGGRRGDRDTSYLDVQVVETVDASGRTSTRCGQALPTWKLSSTEENFGAGSQVMSARRLEGFLVEMYHAFSSASASGAKSRGLQVEPRRGDQNRLEDPAQLEP